MACEKLSLSALVKIISIIQWNASENTDLKNCKMRFGDTYGIDEDQNLSEKLYRNILKNI